MNSIEKQSIEEFSKKVKELLGDNLLEIKLYGSKVRGDDTQESDIDIMIVLKDKNPQIREKIADIAVDINLKYGIILALNIFSKYEYDKNMYFETPFIKNVLKQSINL
ncbi:MAG: nucleotidyltransferase domain-containing protein [Candidatus Hydrogenedentota bacterium]